MDNSNNELLKCFSVFNKITSKRNDKKKTGKA